MAATAAAEAQQQQQQQQQLTPLDVLVQHLHRLPTPLQQVAVCKLQLSGRGVGAAIQQHCTGTLSLRFATYSIDRLKAFAPWLAKHGCLLQSLALEVNVTAQHSCEAEAVIGTALQQAGTSGGSACCNGGAWYSPPGLQLRSCSLHPATVAGPALQQLDSYYLTHLELGRHAAYSCGFAVEGLTRLCALRLFEDSADCLLPSLSGLSSLRRLALVDVASSSIAKLRFVGSGVQELQLSLARLKRSEAPPPGLCLSHLTALTKLNCAGKPLLIQAGDVLPPSLRVLHVRDCMSAAPLLSLPELQELSMCASTTPAAALQQLGSSSSGGGSSSIHPADSSSSDTGSTSSDAAAAGSSASTNSSSSSNLQSVHLTYADMEAAAAAADGWPALPLVSLSLRAAEGCLPAATFDTFRQLGQLQRLDVCGGHGGFAAAAVLGVTQAGLASALRQMRSLQVLSLRGIGLLAASNAAVATTPPPAAAAAVGSCTPASSADAAGCDTCAPAQDQAPADSSITELCCSTQRLSVSADSSSAGQQALQPLLTAAASLPHLGCLTLASITCGQQPMVVDVPAAQALGAASGLTSLQLCDVGLTDAAANALVESGLTQLRRLVLDSNLPLSAAALPDGLAGQLTGLRELSVLRTGIRASGAALGFKARLLALHPGLALKSSAR